MSSIYNGIEFKTPLLAQWAAFFDLAGWRWQQSPIAVSNWVPDFRVEFPCNHSECSGSHTILVSVLPVDSLDGLGAHPALSFLYLVQASDGSFLANAGALFGNSPACTHWEMSHGAGGGIESVDMWVDDSRRMWSEARKKVGAQAKET